MTELEHCKSCDEPIYMLRHPRTGNTAPIEAKTSDGGTILIQLELDEYTVVPKSARPKFPGRLHVNHYATCPQAPAWHAYGKGGKSA